MAITVEVEGIEGDDTRQAQSLYSFRLHCRGLDPSDEVETRRLIEAWYVVGVHGGFDGWMNELKPITKTSTNGTAVLEFGIVGVVSRDALELLARCLDRTDIDTFFDRLAVLVKSAG